MAGGRPTKYNDETLGIATAYIDEYKSYGDIVPSVAGLACVLKVSRDTIYEWVKHKDKEEFSDIIKVLSTAQERSLINGSLGNELNPTISKLLLGKHGYSDKAEIESNVTVAPKNFNAFYEED